MWHAAQGNVGVKFAKLLVNLLILLLTLLLCHAVQGNVGIAFDLMSVNLADVPRLPAIVPALKLLFKEGEEGEEDEEPQPQMLS